MQVHALVGQKINITTILACKVSNIPTLYQHFFYITPSPHSFFKICFWRESIIYVKRNHSYCRYIVQRKTLSNQSIYVRSKEGLLKNTHLFRLDMCGVCCGVGMGPWESLEDPPPSNWNKVIRRRWPGAYALIKGLWLHVKKNILPYEYHGPA